MSWIEENLDKQVVNVDPIGSSNWSSQYCYVTRTSSYEKVNYFVKTAAASDLEMFQSEALGLRALHGLVRILG